MTTSGPFSRVRRLRAIIRFAAASMLHEWVAILCLILALSAVFSPVLVILGLKSGIIAKMRANMLSDPANLELIPRNQMSVDGNLLAQVQAIPGVSFAMPKTAHFTGSNVDVQAGESSCEVALHPTATGDPVLLRHGVMVPKDEGIVLGAQVARELGIERGSPSTEIIIKIQRTNRDGAREIKEKSLPITGVLPLEAGGKMVAYVPLSTLDNLESFRSGLAVPEWGWNGESLPLAEPVFDGIIVCGSAPLGEELSTRISAKLASQSPKPAHEVLSPAFAARLMDSHPVTAYFASRRLERTTLEEVRGMLSGNDMVIYPWSSPRPIAIHAKDNQLRDGVLHVNPFISDPGIDPSDGSIWLHSPPGNAMDGSATLEIASRQGKVPFSARIIADADIDPASPPGSFFASPDVTGLLRNLEDRKLVWDAATKSFRLGKKDYSSMRIYAGEVGDLIRVADELEKMGVPCNSKADEAMRILNLDENLTRLFLIISAFSLAGAAAALGMTIYGTIGRRRRDYGMLRVLGLPRRGLFVLPLLESACISLLSGATALGIYHACATVINRVFAATGQGDSGFCRLEPEHILRGLGTILLLGLLTALAAAIRVTKCSPAEAIRQV
jgi:putative ABC transport system permease protein